MSACVIVDIEVADLAGYEAYKHIAPPALILYGSKYLARGGLNETREGDWQTQRLVIQEFKSIEWAKAWLNSPEYAPARAMLLKFAKSKMTVVEGA